MRVEMCEEYFKRKLIKIGTKQKKSGIWQLDRHAPDFFVS